MTAPETAMLGEYYERLESLDPAEVIDELKLDVMGQDAFLEEFIPFLCLAIRRCVAQMRGVESLDVPRLSSAFIVGPTASGKTHTMKAICKVMDIDFQFIDCSSLTGAGWRGNSVDTELLQLSKMQKMNPGRITLLIWDEADKMRFDRRSDSDSFNAQHTLLKPLDGGIYHFEGGNNKDIQSVDMHCVVNVFAGAFTGIESIVDKRQGGGAATMGFFGNVRGPLSNEDVKKRRSEIWIEDFIEWGMMPELCGRCGAVFNLPALDLSSMKKIVKGSGRSLEAKYGRLVPAGCSLEISDDAAELVAKAAMESPVGVRLLENLLNKVMGTAIAEAARREATSIRVVKTHDDALGYELGFEGDTEGAEGAEGGARAPARLGARAHRAQGGVRAKSIADAIDKSCSRFDLEYFLAGGKNVEQMAGVMAKSAEKCSELVGSNAKSCANIETALVMLLYAVILQEDSEVSLGGLYEEAERALKHRKYLDETTKRQDDFYDKGDGVQNRMMVRYWNKRVVATNKLGEEGEEAWSGALGAVRLFVRYLAIPERLNALKEEVYELYPLNG